MSGSEAPGRSRLDAAPWALLVPLAVACAVVLLRWPGWPLVTDAALDADVPAEPSSTIAVDVDSTLTFSFVPVATP